MENKAIAKRIEELEKEVQKAQGQLRQAVELQRQLTLMIVGNQKAIAELGKLLQKDN